jgi:hypothetical protein
LTGSAGAQPVDTPVKLGFGIIRSRTPSKADWHIPSAGE